MWDREHSCLVPSETKLREVQAGTRWTETRLVSPHRRELDFSSAVLLIPTGDADITTLLPIIILAHMHISEVESRKACASVTSHWQILISCFKFLAASDLHTAETGLVVSSGFTCHSSGNLKWSGRFCGGPCGEQWGLTHSAPACPECCYCALEDEGIFRCFRVQATAVFKGWTLNTTDQDWPSPFFPFILPFFLTFFLLRL